MRWMFPLLKTFLLDYSALKFAIGVVLGVGFSMSVILSTIGLMDGFDFAIKRGLKKSVGDIYLSEGDGFFLPDKELLTALSNKGVTDSSPIVQGQGFFLSENHSQGVIIQGIHPQRFARVTKLKMSLQKREIVIGQELAVKFGLEIGDDVVLLYAAGEHPSLHKYRVSDIVQHDIYQKDLRLVYVLLEDMQETLGLGKNISGLSFNLPSQHSFPKRNHWENIRHFSVDLMEELRGRFFTSPYWEEYSILFDVVKEQKRVIAFMLGPIVMVSIFNVLAFVIFLGEKFSQEFFLFSALGMSKARLGIAWPSIIVFLWVGGVIVSLGFVQLFDWVLGRWSLLQLPGDIYHLDRLTLSLEIGDYALIFFLVLTCLLLISLEVLRRRTRRSILQGLRREFA